MTDKNIILTISKNIKEQLQLHKYTQNDLLAKLHNKGIDVSQQTISNWVKGTKAPRMDKIDALCSIFGISRIELLYDKNSIDTTKYPNTQKVSTEYVHMLGSVACGQPIFMDNDSVEYIEKPDGIKCDFCLRATGDSMIEKGIKDGDIVFVQQTSEVVNGKIYVVAIDEEATLKIVDYDKLNNVISLIPANKNFQVMKYKDEQLEHIHILGRAIYFKRYL